MPDTTEILESGEQLIIQTTNPLVNVSVRGDGVLVQPQGGDTVEVTEGDRVSIDPNDSLQYIIVESQSPDKIIITEVGREGPPGIDLHYQHNQNTPSKTWAIHHSLNKYPSVEVVDSAGTIVEGCTTYVDRDNIVISFSAQFSGRAYLN